MPQRPLAGVDFVLLVVGAAVGSMLAICSASTSCTGSVACIVSATCTVTIAGASTGVACVAATVTGLVGGTSMAGAPMVWAVFTAGADGSDGGCGRVAAATCVFGAWATSSKP